MQANNHYTKKNCFNSNDIYPLITYTKLAWDAREAGNLYIEFGVRELATSIVSCWC